MVRESFEILMDKLNKGILINKLDNLESGSCKEESFLVGEKNKTDYINKYLTNYNVLIEPVEDNKRLYLLKISKKKKGVQNA